MEGCIKEGVGIEAGPLDFYASIWFFATLFFQLCLEGVSTHYLRLYCTSMDATQEMIRHFRSELVAMQYAIIIAQAGVASTEKEIDQATREGRPTEQLRKFLSSASSDIKQQLIAMISQLPSADSFNQLPDNTDEELILRGKSDLTALYDAVNSAAERSVRVEHDFTVPKLGKENLVFTARLNIAPQLGNFDDSCRLSQGPNIIFDPENFTGEVNQVSEQRFLDTHVKYLYMTESWGCVTVIRKRIAATFGHSEHRHLKIGDEINIYSSACHVKFGVKVYKIHPMRDWILLKSYCDLCDDEPLMAICDIGSEYRQFGISASHKDGPKLSVTKGFMRVLCDPSSKHYVGSTECNGGDSGGPCFARQVGYMIGINCGSERPSLDVETTGTCHAVKYESRSLVIPVANLVFGIYA